MFQISDKTISGTQLTESLMSDDAGALVVFEGWVRDRNEGKSVLALEYEAFLELAMTEGEKVIAEAMSKFDVINIVSQHRTGHLSIGEIAVWIGATSEHREDAFRACRYVIDEIKARLPIWKKEHYVDGHAEWVNCQGCAHHAHIHYSEDDYYKNQQPAVGSTGQSRLKSARVLVVGAGGLGSPALQYLAAAGVGQISICDSGQLEISDLHSHTLYSYADLGENKAILAQRRLMSHNPNILIKAVTDAAQLSNIKDLIDAHDLVVDCSGKIEVQYLLNDACRLADVGLVQASMSQTAGQLKIFTGKGCLRCADDEGFQDVESDLNIDGLGVNQGVVGTIMASEILKLILGGVENSSAKTIAIKLDHFQISQHHLDQTSDCSICGKLQMIDDSSRSLPC